MPHRAYGITEMNQRHPKIDIHDAQHDHDDFVRDEEDTTLQLGMRIAEDIQGSAEEHGRRRLQRQVSDYACGARPVPGSHDYQGHDSQVSGNPAPLSENLFLHGSSRFLGIARHARA